MIKHVIWASMIDYPEHTCTVLFTGNCNFKCAYCYNKTLVHAEDLNFYEKILPVLIERKDFIDHVIISGGEPTVDPHFDYIMDKLYENGFKIGLHTNGTNPEKLKQHLNKIEFIGMDIKSSFSKYNSVAGVIVDIEKIKTSIKLILESNIKYEFRTTLFPKEVDKNDVIEIATILKELGAKKYHLQQFYPVNGAENVPSYTLETINNMTEECNKIIPTILKTK